MGIFPDDNRTESDLQERLWRKKRVAGTKQCNFIDRDSTRSQLHEARAEREIRVDDLQAPLRQANANVTMAGVAPQEADTGESFAG